MNVSNSGPAIFLAIIVLQYLAAAAEIVGQIAAVDDKAVTITTSGDLLPASGDKLTCAEIPGVGKAIVGTGTVTSITDGIVQATIDPATGRVRTVHLVNIQSAKPTKRRGPAVPLLIGRAAAVAKKLVEDLGLQAEFKTGEAAPQGVKPYTDYLQDPPAKSVLQQGGNVVVTLYADNGPTPPTSTTRPPSQPFGPLAFPAGPPAISRQITQAVCALLPKEHLSGHPLDDEIGRRAWGNLLGTFDANKIYFTKEEIDEFARRVDQFDNELRRGDLNMVYDLARRYLRRVRERVVLAEELLGEELDFTADEQFESAIARMDYPREHEVRERWRLRLKYDLSFMMASGDSLDEARQKLRRRFESFDSRMQKMTDNELLEHALTAVAHAYDPHSAYVSSRTYDNMTIANQRQMVGIGASLQLVDGQVKVVKVIPGGPAARDGRLQATDRIIAVGQGPFEEMTDVVGMPLQDVVEKIRGEKGTQVRLRVLPEGSFESNVLTLTRNKFQFERAEGAVLPVDLLPDNKSVRVGFIRLPTFYGKFPGADESVTTSTDDLRKILGQFTAADVDVAVLDLRNNGGGPLPETISVAGLFLGDVPVVQVKDRDGRVTSYSATGAKAVWDGPLVILTNMLTGGGSEILAGACQDYGRALIVGDRRTAGDGTVQSFLDVGRRVFQMPNPPKLGYMTVTTQRFYRPSGQGTQMTGVIPDLTIPSLMSQMDLGEEFRAFALQADKINAVPLKKSATLTPAIVQNLVAGSRLRRQNSPYFRTLADRIAAQIERKKQTLISLNKDKVDVAHLQPEKEADGADALLGVPDVKLDDYLREVFVITTEYALHLDNRRSAAVID